MLACDVAHDMQHFAYVGFLGLIPQAGNVL